MTFEETVRSLDTMLSSRNKFLMIEFHSIDERQLPLTVRVTLSRHSLLPSTVLTSVLRLRSTTCSLSRLRSNFQRMGIRLWETFASRPDPLRPATINGACEFEIFYLLLRLSFYNYLQGNSLHVRTATSIPKHFLPLYWGAGSLQDRRNIWNPPPHSLLHSSPYVQSDQPPSTRTRLETL